MTVTDIPAFLLHAPDGVVVRYADIGRGRPLVLLHGFTDRLEGWFDLGYAAPLLEAGRRLVLIDARGHGGSGRPHDPAAYGAERRAGDVAAVLDALGIAQADVWGYSMGGWMGFALLRHHPGRVRRLVAGGAHPFAQDLGPLRRLLAGGIEPWLAAVEAQAGPLPAGMRRRLLDNDAGALRAAVAEDRGDLSAALAAFPRPCLFYAGGDDPVRAGAEQAGGLAPRGRHVGLPGLNHMTAFARADAALAAVLPFLDEPA
ncbi:MAG TPA: alpha/beta fold hydrolase [Azospirillaceae bacterium]|nr:alpha/beta fold hydrolase [Azospirillaceae bacterium]